MVSPARASKTQPSYALSSVDNALALASYLQLEGKMTVSEAASRLGIGLSTAHRTSGGLASLAELSDSDLQALYQPELLSEGEELPDIAELLHRVSLVRRQGFALNQGLSERGVTGIGHTIRSGNQSMVGLAIAIPTARFDGASLSATVSALRQAVHQVEFALNAAREAATDPSRHEAAPGNE